MSVTQVYFLAHKARAKLSGEAARSDHNLRLLVGHANLLDSLMLEIADAEREQESWFNHSVRSAAPVKERHVQWADSIVEDDDEDDEEWQAESSSDDSSDDSDEEEEEYDEDEVMADAMALRRMQRPALVAPQPPASPRMEVDDQDVFEVDDDEEDYAQLALSRTHSHSSQPPELDHDEDTSEDESMPPSPESSLIDSFAEGAEEEHDAAAALQEQDKDKSSTSFYDQGFYLPPRSPARLVTAISVY